MKSTQVLDIDALKVVSKGINQMRGEEFRLPNDYSLPTFIKLHHSRLRSRYDEGRIVKSGGPELSTTSRS